jgi:hypothetical protein
MTHHSTHHLIWSGWIATRHGQTRWETNSSGRPDAAADNVRIATKPHIRFARTRGRGFCGDSHAAWHHRATHAMCASPAGGGAGLLAALGVIAIPGIGPLVAAGVLATTLVGAAGGGAVGGMLGALTDYGVSEEDAHLYSEAVRRGSTLVTVRADEGRVAKAESILDANRPVNTRERRDAYTASGWSKYDPASKPYTADEIRQERDRYRRR